MESLETIFNEIQGCNSRQLSERLSDALKIIPTSSTFLGVVDTLLLCQRSIPPRILYFVRRIFEELGQASPSILQSILEYVSDKLSCRSTKVRRNSLRLAGIIVALDVGLMTDELIQKISERLFDKEQGVRKEALRICLGFQSLALGRDLRVQATLKDVIRYDQSHEVRRLGLLGLDICPSTINCVLERCVDTNSTIRRTFWTSCFPKIDMRCVSRQQRIFLMKKAFTEREFDAREIFVQRLREMDADDVVEHFYCEEPEYTKCIEMYLEGSAMEPRMERLTPGYLHFMLVYYRYRENADGRDSLKLAPLEEHLQTLYLKCGDLETMARDEGDSMHAQTKVVKYLFRMLDFYDIFTDESKKRIMSIIDGLIVRSSVSEIVEESVILAKRVCGAKMVNFLGSIVKRTRGQPICYVLCEHVLKHVPFGEIHDAILSEIATMDMGQSLGIFYWYIVGKHSSEVEGLYTSFLPNKRVVEGTTDLILMGLADVSRIKDYLLTQISRFNESVVVPATKLLLAGKIEDSELVKHLLLMFYTSETDHIRQYLALFFYEFFRKDSIKLAEVYCDVLEVISSNQRTFVAQSLFWTSGSRLCNGTQHLFFHVALYILNNYECLQNRRYLFETLERIPAVSGWDCMLTKKIITLLGLVLKKRPRENVSLLLSRLMEADDGAPLPTKEYGDLRSLITNK